MAAGGHWLVVFVCCGPASRVKVVTASPSLVPVVYSMVLRQAELIQGNHSLVATKHCRVGRSEGNALYSNSRIEGRVSKSTQVLADSSLMSNSRTFPC